MRWFRHTRTARLQTLPSVDAYALWAESYPPYAHNRLMEIEQETMQRLMPTLADRHVLDLACGTGRYGLLARAAGARKVVGVDNSLSMLRAGQLRPVAEASMDQLPFVAQAFDVVLCGLATGHLPPSVLSVALAELARVLRPGGEALISDFHPFHSVRGGQRTFTAPDGTAYAVEHHTHLVSDYFNALRQAGLTITAMAEPRAVVGGQEVLAVLVIRCQRP